MATSRFSASAESFSSSVSSSPSASEDCECLECEQIYPTPPTPSRFRRTFPSLSKLQIPATPLHSTLPSSTTLQKQKAQMSSMGYSKLFNIGYFSATGALRSSG